MLELFMLLLDPDPPAEHIVIDAISASQRTRRKRCDDGSSPFHLDGSPNWHCHLAGCPPLDAVCWPERLDICFNEDGDDAGVCTVEETKCETVTSCFVLWAGCDGEWNYDWDTGIGVCKVGHLKAPTQVKPGFAHTLSSGSSAEMCEDPRVSALFTGPTGADNLVGSG